MRYVSLSRNFGKEAALTAGLDRARGDVVLLMDADLQHPPALIADMLRAWHDGADMVYTVRATRGDESFLKKLGTRIFYRIVNAGSAVPIPANAGDFRLLDRSVVDALRSLPERNRFMKGLYAWVGFRTSPCLRAGRALRRRQLVLDARPVAPGRHRRDRVHQRAAAPVERGRRDDRRRARCSAASGSSSSTTPRAATSPASRRWR